MSDSIFLDNQSTTPTDPRVRDAMLPYLAAGAVGNPHSDHVAGRRSSAAVEAARSEVANLIGARPEEIVFTSGATEANNIALQGVMRSPNRLGDHMLTCATEHKCVLETAAYLGRNGCHVNVLPVGEDGVIDLSRLRDAITEETALVSIMTANNETSVLQPVGEIASLCRSLGVMFHTDAAQATGKIPLDVKTLGVDLLSLSGHKLYAPIGIGALYVSEDALLMPEPLFWGGNQERGLRSGTLPTHMCVALGTASAIASRELNADAENASAMLMRFLDVLRAHFPHVRINCEQSARLPGSVSMTFLGVDADRMVGAVQPHVAISTNAACTSGVIQPSHVLRAIGLSEGDAAGTVRISFGRFNTMSEVEQAAERLASVAKRIRGNEPLDIAAA